MKNLVTLTALLASSITISASSDWLKSESGISESEMLLLLPGRSICRGLDGSKASLAARLASADAVGSAQHFGHQPMSLYSAIPQTDLPLGDIDPLARRYFEQGLALAYGFNHRAAIRSFRQAQAIDPDCAMCWWGVAMASGPNINAGMSDGDNSVALEAIARAQQLAPSADGAVAQLVEAQALRFSPSTDAERTDLDAAYAKAMLGLAARYRESDDLAVLAAESAMNTAPWNYWDLPTGQPRPLIAEAVALIEKVNARSPAHPQAAHLYIHLLELPEPKRAEAAADRLRKSGPASLGHLVHMPSHIYYRIGRYADSVAANRDAVRADEAYLAAVGDDGMVRYGYYPHNVHFLLTSAQMMGDMQTVISQSAKLESIIDVETGRELPWVQAIYAAPYFAVAQYGSAASTLALASEAHPLPYVEAMRHYARAVAMARTKDAASFERELAALNAQRAAPQIAALDEQGFPASVIIDLAGEMAQGRMKLVAGQPRAAIAHFEAAARLEKSIPYNEPPFWYHPVSQSLGAAHYMAGDFDAARNAFRRALLDAPNDALALFGLAKAESALGNIRASTAAREAFDAIWKGPPTGISMELI